MPKASGLVTIDIFSQSGYRADNGANRDDIFVSQVLNSNTTISVTRVIVATLTAELCSNWWLADSEQIYIFELGEN